MKRTFEDRERFTYKIDKNSYDKLKSKKYVKDGGHRNNHVNYNAAVIDIDALEQMFED